MTQAVAKESSGASKTDVILRASAIRKLYRMGETEVEVLKGIDLSIKRGEFIAIEGRSGSGKSTLLHVLGGLESIDGGDVEFDGRDYTARHMAVVRESWLKKFSRWCFRGWVGSIIGFVVSAVASAVIFTVATDKAGELPLQLWTKSLWIAGIGGALFVLWLVLLGIRAFIHHGKEAPLSNLRNEQFGFVFQFYHLLPELNVLENALLTPMIGAPSNLPKSERRARHERARKVLEELGMGHRLKHRPNQLSGGERQRVAIARALMNKPRVLFADEPTGNLDAETGKQIMAVFEGLHRDHGQTIVMVTHDRTLARRADRVLILRDGRVERAAEVAHEG